ncbi:MAG: shikimate kinase [Desulfobulbaceae bacterium]|uniref:Shikimate kinase n=1 Tax=Candidatus Desulfatifera sulfidica TaxID=2841691 RepID=A0A8J6N9L8_9BACT|nr:shikimate kinase [Candidatus Desulfatifera sulfidica]
MNIVLIGMAGAGKSSVGPVLAKSLARPFVDVDTLMEQDQGLSLQEIVDRKGQTAFRIYEEQTLLSLDLTGHVIATGGSAIYSELGIRHLKQSSHLVLLDVPLDLLEERVDDVDQRGLVRQDQQSFSSLYWERRPLYHRHADLIIDCSGKSITGICQVIVARLAMGSS